MTERCLNSVVQYTHLPYELICIDNGSTDGTQGRLRNRTDILLIENSTNRGFAGACNQGISAARGDMMLLLNNDTVVSHRWLQNLVLTLHSSSDIGIVGPVSNMVMPMQRVPMSYATYEEYHPFAEIFNRHNPYLWRETTAVSGFCMLFPRCLIDKIGMLDEGFATGGYEDIDFGYRALKAGFRLIVAGDTHVHHEGNASFRSNSIDMAEQARKNRRSFIRKWGFNPERLIYTVDELFFYPEGTEIHTVIMNRSETRCQAEYWLVIQRGTFTKLRGDSSGLSYLLSISSVPIPTGSACSAAGFYYCYDPRRNAAAAWRHVPRALPVSFRGT